MILLIIFLRIIGVLKMSVILFNHKLQNLDFYLNINVEFFTKNRKINKSVVTSSYCIMESLSQQILSSYI